LAWIVQDNSCRDPSILKTRLIMRSLGIIITIIIIITVIISVYVTNSTALYGSWHSNNSSTVPRWMPCSSRSSPLDIWYPDPHYPTSQFIFSIFSVYLFSWRSSNFSVLGRCGDVTFHDQICESLLVWLSVLNRSVRLKFFFFSDFVTSILFYFPHSETRWSGKD
jgi:hypothetical protein